MIFTVTTLFLGILLLTFGAEWFVRGSSSMAARLGISPLIIGITVVAFGTSAPELFVSVKSALASYPGIAVGNVIGSNIANIALILGACAVMAPIRISHRVVERDAPLMVIITGICFLLLLDRGISRIDAVILLALFVGYVFFSIKHGGLPSNTVAKAGGNSAVILVLIVGGLGALLIGADLLIGSGVKTARHLGVNETIIGISIIAFGTSIPELATSVMATAKKESDIAIGNIVGSNVFNIGLVLGGAGAICPFTVPDLARVDVGIMLFISILLFPLLWTGFRLSRVEGLFLLLFYTGYMFFLWR